jgi:ABC-type tungstate transport system substrate-binding protein
MNHKWLMPSQDKQNEINTIIDTISQYASLIIIVAIFFLISYIYFRNKANLKYSLDAFVIGSFLLILYIVVAPHRYQGFAYFISMTFR